MNKKILIVDDSAFVRDFLNQLIKGQDGLEVCGLAIDGDDACKKVKETKPDIVLMDIHMPGKSGIDATKWIMENVPTPVIVVTNDDTKETAIKAIEVGAMEIILKPTINDIENKGALKKFVETIREISDVKIDKKNQNKSAADAEAKKKDIDVVDFTGLQKKLLPYQIISIASSTGGPKVLYEILPQIEEIPLPILVTQHLSKDFADQMIEWLNKEMKREVIFAEDGKKASDSSIIFAPPEIHMTIESDGTLRNLDEPKVNFQKPSADYMFSSMAKSYKGKSIGVILSGMGKDGAVGMLDVFNAGGYTIAQSEESCVVFGMPKEAIRLKAVKEILPYYDIPNKLKHIISGT